jgi:hypothetical protein
MFFIKDRQMSTKRVRGFAKQGHLMKQTNSQEQGYSPARGSAERGKEGGAASAVFFSKTIFFDAHTWLFHLLWS